MLGTGSASALADEPKISDPFREFYADVSTDVDPRTRSELTGRYDDVDAVRSEFEAATPVLKALAADGHLDSASLSEFAFDGVREDALHEPTDAASNVGVSAVDHPEGASALLAATTRTEDHEVAIYRQPERDLTYAFVGTDDGQVVYHDFDDDVSTMKDCGWEAIDCTNSWCDFGDPPWCEEYQRYCCLMADGSYNCTDSRYACACRC